MLDFFELSDLKDPKVWFELDQRQLEMWKKKVEELEEIGDQEDINQAKENVRYYQESVDTYQEMEKLR